MPKETSKAVKAGGAKKVAMAPITYTIDATSRTLGRVASDVAHALLGKRSAHYDKSVQLPIHVTVTNAAKMHLPLRRTAGKVYTRYTGYPGGFKETVMKDFIAKKGVAETLRKTVDGMIPRNRLRKSRMFRLTIKD